VAIRNDALAGQLEIEIGSSCVIRLTGTIEPKLLRVAIRAAGQLDGNERGTN
jgi:hypothetical protein